MNNVSFSDFQKLDIRVGTVTEAIVPEWSHWVMKLKVDLGSEIGERIIFAGIMKFYKPEQLVNKQFPFVVNLEPKKMGPMGDFSQGMMIMAVANDETPVLFKLWKKVPNGTKVR